MPNTLIPLEYFPLSVATGPAFCNRTDEIEKLKTYIFHHRPILLTSPRRYGKTSLALCAIQKTGLPYAHIDFFSAVDEQDIEKVISKGIGKLLSMMESIPKKALALANEIFDSSHIRVVLSKFELSLEMNRKNEKPAYYILELLERLERLAEKAGKKIILFFDEFQCLAEIAEDQSMEGVLRQVAQLTKSISFVFSGSNRHLLHQLFDDRNRPFYKLCERITIDRISEEAYAKHIQIVAQKTWKSNLSEKVIDLLFSHSERHPYYVNLLCSRILLEKNLPDEEILDKIWSKYILEERSNVASELELLSKNQRKLLTILARTNGTSSALGKEFIYKANMSKTTITQSLTFLEKKDYVMRSSDGYVSVLDPLIKALLA